MKTKILLFFIISLTLLTSCSTTSYFQVYKTAPIGKVSVKSDFLVYEDANCEIKYDFWSEDGNIGFTFYNKTDKTIYLNLEESYFILNDIAHKYFQNRTFTNSKNIGSSAVSTVGGTKSVTGLNYFDLLQTNKMLATSTTGVSSSEGYSVAYMEEKLVSIPAYAAKIVSEYSINSSLYRDCDLFKYPTRKQIKTKSFTKTTSPLVFSNRLVYLIGKNGIPVNLVNEFYVTEITNYPDDEITEKRYENFCGQKKSVSTLYFKNVSPEKFYIKYTPGNDFWEH
jgi:hypothetical protein